MSVSFIAEVSSNHHQSIERCYQFIDVAAEIGCDSVKFQLFRIDQLFSKEILNKNKEIRDRKNWELPLEFIPLLAERCKFKKISFGCTPFDLEAVKFKPYVDFYKKILWITLGWSNKSCCLTISSILSMEWQMKRSNMQLVLKIRIAKIFFTSLHFWVSHSNWSM